MQVLREIENDMPGVGSALRLEVCPDHKELDASLPPLEAKDPSDGENKAWS